MKKKLNFKIKKIYAVLDTGTGKLVHTTDHILQTFRTKKLAEEFRGFMEKALYPTL